MDWLTAPVSIRTLTLVGAILFNFSVYLPIRRSFSILFTLTQWNALSLPADSFLSLSSHLCSYCYNHFFYYPNQLFQCYQVKCLFLLFVYTLMFHSLLQWHQKLSIIEKNVCSISYIIYILHGHYQFIYIQHMSSCIDILISIHSTSIYWTLSVYIICGIMYMYRELNNVCMYLGIIM